MIYSDCVETFLRFGGQNKDFYVNKAAKCQ